jgi:hypothetical protein
MRNCKLKNPLQQRLFAFFLRRVAVPLLGFWTERTIANNSTLPSYSLVFRDLVFNDR